jgi:RsiW-degrading membrane proteinase PrsW (M82 family)
MSKRWKQIIMASSLMLVVVGVLFAFNALCIAPLVILVGYDQQAIYQAAIYGIFSSLAMLLTMVMGIVCYIHANRSMRGIPSKPMALPQPWILIAVFLLLLFIGMIASAERNGLLGLLIPPTMLVLAVLPPLWAVAWFTPRDPQQSQLTWRRGLVALCGGATVSIVLALLLETIIPLTIMSLLVSTGQSLLETWGRLLDTTSSSGLVAELTNPTFVYFFILVAVIAPLVEELVKPLVTLPLLRQLNRQEAFWVGALAGAGFAAVENVIYAGGGYSIWPGILFVRAIGVALHPLCAGLVTLGWREVLNREPGAVETWFKQYGFAVLIHAIWNGGSLLVITLGGAQFFGVLPAEIDLLGLSMAGTTLAFLVLLGIACLWVGRGFGHNRPLLATPEPSADSASEAGSVLSERATALWALACLLAIVPIGIAGFKLWVR